ncbi:conserved hypothetical protein (plasmid) [Methylobacterium nodulans ORS 2060]|uniref:Uncharacterized protein n=1 Tax=Methylobacterium nodulans (strain LMG 21967 / CNCM I-2342 / ORS 2060) TaxID=460265 RepID=B8IY62_METNO|nr:conserved hypothetical protein [Methylobacterium nodulans ORS 2060]
MTPAYRLPRTIAERLETALRGRKNAAAALALAEWLGRFWSTPRRLLSAFPIDRRAIAGREDLGLSEARVRGAIAALEEVGFLDRDEPAAGRRYQRTEEGLHRRAMTFRFGSDYGTAFATANARAQRARGAPAPARRPITPPAPLRPPVSLPAPSRAMPAAQVAHKQSSGEALLLMGEQTAREPTSPLEDALERLRVSGGFAPRRG